MATNTNIKLTADVKAFRQSFGEAAGSVKSFTSEFQRRASEVEKIGGRIAVASKNLNLSTDTRKFAGGITSTFESLNRELNVAAGREQLFGASLDTTRSKINAYQGALNSLLGSGMKPTSVEARSLTAEIQRLNAEANKFKPVQRGPNIMGNVGSVLAGQVGGGALGAIGGAFGPIGAGAGIALDKLVDLTRTVSLTTDRFEGYRTVLQNVTGSQYAAGQAFQFAVNVANESGFRIQTVQDAYKGFAGSGRQAGLSMSELNKIFQATTRYGATFKLSNDQIGGSLLALSQMLSKGKVSAEELRGQLGERMPGAFAIFAKAMGVSESQLGKMLENGQILAKDALPKFAAALEKITGQNYEKNLKTMSGSFSVLQNNVDLLMDAFGRSSEVNTFFASINRGLSGTVTGLTQLVESGQWREFVGVLLQRTGIGMGVGIAIAGGTAGSILGKANERGKLLQDFPLKSLQERNAQATKLVREINEESRRVNSNFYANANARNDGLDRLKEKKALLQELILLNKKQTEEEFKAAFAKKPNNDPAVDPKALDKLIKSMIDASNDRLGDGLRGVQMKSLGRELEALSRESKIWKVAPILTIVPKEAKFDKELAQKQIQSRLGTGIKVAVNVVPTFEGDSSSASIAIQAYFKNLGGIWEANAATFGEIGANAIGNALGAGFAKMGATIGTTENPFKAFGEGILKSFGDTLIQVGTQMIQQAALILTSALFGGIVSPIAMVLAKKTLVAGGAITLAGGAMKAVKLADGGFMSKSTFANMGEYDNARINPEIAAPLDKLIGITRKALLPDIAKLAAMRSSGGQPIYITTINTTDGRETSRSTKRYDTQKSYRIP